MGQGPIAFDEGVDPKVLQNKLTEDFKDILDSPEQLQAIDCTEQPCIAHVEVSLEAMGDPTEYLKSIAGKLMSSREFERGLSFRLDSADMLSGANTIRASFVINPNSKNIPEKNRTTHRINKYREAS